MLSKDGAERKYELLNAALKKAVKAGLDVKVSVPQNATKDVVENFSKITKIKQHKAGTARFCIIDNKELLLFLTDDTKVHKSYDCAVWVEAPQFVEYFNTLFDREWKSN